ncbi:MAG: hypothetical protein ACM3RP_07150, partial [Chitinophagales bacterium]
FPTLQRAKKALEEIEPEMVLDQPMNALADLLCIVDQIVGCLDQVRQWATVAKKRRQVPTGGGRVVAFRPATEGRGDGDCL